MLTETGRVVAVQADSLWVETIRSSTCGGCAARSGCGHGLLSRLGEGRRGLVRVLPGALPLAQCHVDDRVRISIPEEVVLRGSLIVYVLPMICMLGGALLSAELLPGAPDVLAASGAFAGLAGGFALVRWHGLRHRSDTRLQPVLVAVLGPWRAAEGTAAAPVAPLAN